MTGCLKVWCSSLKTSSAMTSGAAAAAVLPGNKQLLKKLIAQAVRFSSSSSSSFDSRNLQVEFCPPSKLQPKPPANDLGFGKHFTDHMLKIKWTANEGWAAPKIGPLENFQMHPAAKVLHYAQELFEGMKAYRGHDDKIRMFRPLHNMVRLNGSAERACLPTFEGTEFVKCMRRLIQLDQEWVPHQESASLYIRPTMIGTEPTLGVGAANEVELFVILSPVGPYFAGGLKPVNLLADPRYVRAWPGGCGYVKMGSNYAPTLWTQKMAESEGCHQCLWLVGEDHEITEVGAMNIFILMQKPDSTDLELVTPPLHSGCILPGVTRRSILELTREWAEFEVSERKITMGEVMKAKNENRLVEIFGCGTAAIVCPVGGIKYEDKMVPIPVDESDKSISVRLRGTMSDIYYGRVDHPWGVDIENWTEMSDLEEKRLKDYKESIVQHMHIYN